MVVLDQGELMARPASDDGHHRPSVAVDVVVLTVVDDALGLLVHRRPEPPFEGSWALPGAFVGAGESLDVTAARVLRAKAGLSDVWVEQLYTFSDPHRDPRSRVISVGHLALVDLHRVRTSLPEGAEVAVADVVVRPGDHGTHDNLAVHAELEGRPVDLAFDHERIVATAVTRLRGKLDYTPVGYQLLRDEFTLRELRRVHEVILGRELTAPNFRRSMLASGELEATGTRESDVEHRPAELYRFRPP